MNFRLQSYRSDMDFQIPLEDSLCYFFHSFVNDKKQMPICHSKEVNYTKECPQIKEKQIAEIGQHKFFSIHCIHLVIPLHTIGM